MAAIENFVLKIKVEGQKAVDDLSKSITGLGTTIGGFGANAGRMTSAISGIVGGLGGMASIAGTAAAAFVGLGMRAIAMADDLSDISDATGIATGALNNFKNSLVDAGGKTEDFSTLAAKLNQNVGDAAVGNEKAQQAFRKLGVFVTDAGGAVRNTGDILRDAISKLAAIEDPATRASLAVDLFGKSAAKLDFTKLNAANDFAKDEQIAQLAKYQTAIDNVAKAINDNLLTAFGKLAIGFNEYNKAIDENEKRLNALGRTSRQFTPGGPGATMANPVGSGPERRMTDAEKEYLLAEKTRKEYEAQQKALMSVYKTRAQTGATIGGFGATPEATLKAIAESRKRLAASNIESDKNERLKAANEIQAIEINAAAETQKAWLAISTQERISEAQMATEFAAKKKEIDTKAALDTAKVRSQLNAKIFTEEEAQRQKSAEELAAEEQRLNKLFETGRKITEQAAEQNKELATKAKLALDTATMTDRERANAEELFKIEQDRLALLKQIADTYGNEEFAKRTAEEKKINDLLNKRKEDAIANQQATAEQQQNFSAGWEKAYRQYVENSNNSFNQASQTFATVSRGFEDSMVRFVQTGKLSFKDLFNTLIAEAVRANSSKLFAGLFGGGGGGGLFGAIGSLFGGFFANGGEPPMNKVSVVGENGPELFVPRQAGTIIPNGGLGGQTVNTAVTYNIQAVDASSFRSLVARDPEFIHNVVEQGRRQMPIRSRR